MGPVVARSGIEDFKVTEFYDFYYMWMSFATVLQLKLPVGNKALEHEETVFMMQFHFDWLPVMESVSYKLTGHFF